MLLIPRWKKVCGGTVILKSTNLSFLITTNY